jgi:phage I-like protein
MPKRLRRAQLEQDKPKNVVELSLGLIELSAESAPPSEFRVLKAGTTQTSKGIFTFTPESAKKVLEAARQYGNDFPIDYNHAMHQYLSVDPAESGKAAGWFKPTIRAGELWATDVRWTPKAAQMLKDREFRYFSPVFHHSDDGEVQDIVSVGLTNTPATYGMDPLMASKLGPQSQPPPENKMDRSLLIALLSLSKDATDADITAALQRSHGALAELCAVTGQKDGQAALGAVKAWKASADTVPGMVQRIEALEKKDKEAQLSALIDEGKRAGKVTPALEPVIRTLPFEQAQTFIAALSVTTPAKAPHQEPAPGKTGANGSVIQLTAEDQHVSGLLGIDPKTIAELRAKTGGVIPVGALKKEDRAE